MLYFLVMLCSLAAAVQGYAKSHSLSQSGIDDQLHYVEWTKVSSTRLSCSLPPNLESTPPREIPTPARTNGKAFSPLLVSSTHISTHQDSGSHQLRSILMLRHSGLLAHRPAELLLRSSRHHLHHSPPLRLDLRLARRHELMATPLCKFLCRI